MMELFDPQMAKIIRLISDQVEAAARKNAKIDVSISVQWNVSESDGQATLPRWGVRRLALSQLSDQGVVCVKGYSVWNSSSMVRTNNRDDRSKLT
jgi:hypothetical protein